MNEELEEEIRQIIGDIQCPKDFKCYRSGFENLCKATQVNGVDGVVSYLECLEEDPQECVFSRYVSVGDYSFHICACPLRKYIASKKTPEK